jgi:hypothetical protein
VDTFGPEACDLMAAAGKPLDPWQRDAVTLMLATREDGRYACFEYVELVARQNGKGGLLEARALAGLLLLGEELIMWSAHEYKTAMEAFRRVRSLIYALGERVGENDNLVDVDGVIIKISNTNGEESFERTDTSARIKFIARSKGSGRGFSGDINIIDEAFAYTDEQHEALMPTMNARPNGQIIYTSSPPLTSTTGEVLFALRERAEKGGDDSLGYRDWGAEGNLDELDEIDLDDRELWAATNPARGHRITEETIARNRRSMSKRGFAREILGIWPVRAQGGGLVNPAVWADLGPKDGERLALGDDLVLAFEVAHDRSSASITAYSPVGDGVGLVEVVDKRPGTDWVVQRLLQLREKWNPVAVGVDGKGPALSLVLDCEAAGIKRPEDPDNPARGDLMVLRLEEMAAACGQLLDAITQKTIRHLGDDDLTAAVLNAKTRSVGDLEVWGRRNAAVDISPLTGITVARRVYLSRMDLITRKRPKRVPMAAWA